jgi:hypothetical protein
VCVHCPAAPGAKEEKKVEQERKQKKNECLTLSSTPTARSPLPARATPPGFQMAAASPSPAPPAPTDDVDLPRAAVRKIVKARLAESVPDDGKEPGLSKDAVAALAESAKVS